MCTVLLPPGDNPIAVNKYISYIIATSALVWLTKRTELERNIRAGRECEALGPAIRFKYETPFLDQSIVRFTFFLRTVTSQAIVQLQAPLFCDVSSLHWEMELAKGRSWGLSEVGSLLEKKAPDMRSK